MNSDICIAAPVSGQNGSIYIKYTRTVAVAALAVMLSGCGIVSKKSEPTAAVNPSALATMERVALAVNRCWFNSGAPEFKKYRLSPELNSFTGRPRILIVPHNNPNGRPVLVVQAEGNPAELVQFGPLMQSPLSQRITHDTKRWASGQKSC